MGGGGNEEAQDGRAELCGCEMMQVRSVLRV